MKVGLKLFPDDMHLMRRFRYLFDFFELMVTPDMDLGLLEKVKDYTITIHAAHKRFGFDPSERGRYRHNRSIVDNALKAADKVGAPCVILHPGTAHKEDSWRTMVDFLRTVGDTRILIENMPLQDSDDGRYLLATPAEVKTLSEQIDIGFLLDYSHAICTANTLGEDPAQLISRFEALGPSAYHLSGQDPDTTADEHKFLYEAHNSYSFLRSMKPGSWVTLETAIRGRDDPRNHERDFETIRAALRDGGAHVAYPVSAQTSGSHGS